MFDSWAKIPAGILKGNSFDFGNFDECAEIKYDTMVSNAGVVQGQYCLAPTKFDLSSLSESLP